MYIIKQHGKRYGKKTFATYDDARSVVRKFVRKAENGWFYPGEHPNLSYAETHYGFTIKAV